MTQPVEITSVLTADIGSAWTHVALLDQVEGVYRLIARGEAPPCVGQSPRPLAAVVEVPGVVVDPQAASDSATSPASTAVAQRVPRGEAIMDPQCVRRLAVGFGGDVRSPRGRVT